MQITLKNYELLNVCDFMGELLKLKTSIKVNWNINKNTKKLILELESYLKYEYELVKKYAIKNGDELVLDENKQPKFAPSNKEKYLKERQELLGCETNTIDILKINLSDLINDENKIDGNWVTFFEFMINDDLNEIEETKEQNKK